MTKYKKRSYFLHLAAIFLSQDSHLFRKDSIFEVKVSKGVLKP